jgi:hypothetical protein
MRNFTQIGKADVLPLRLQIERNTQLWNQHTGRTERADSPHNGISDIWLRWRPESALVSGESFNEPCADIEWYPSMLALPAARDIILQIMGRVHGLSLGGCIITRIPPGAQVRPHNDEVSWHAQHYRLKVYVVVKTNPNVSQWVDGESFVPEAGDVFSYNNLISHAVYNEGDDERITLMAAIRCE